MTWRQLQTERGCFWVSTEEHVRDLEQVISEQRPHSPHLYESGEFRVREGDTVLDLGAHLGVFTRVALDMGAARVVAVEPDEEACEGLRRTFSREIGLGLVAVVNLAATSVTSGVARMTGSGIRCHIEEGAAAGIEVVTTTVDAIVETLGLDRVDFIKLDIEGSERVALAGAAETIRRFKPSIACCAYHCPDDIPAILGVVRCVRNDYTTTCGPIAPWMTVPVLLFFWR